MYMQLFLTIYHNKFSRRNAILTFFKGQHGLNLESLESYIYEKAENREENKKEDWVLITSTYK